MQLTDIRTQAACLLVARGHDADAEQCLWCCSIMVCMVVSFVPPQPCCLCCRGPPCSCLQLRQAGGGAPLPVALKVMECSDDDACSFERVYNEVGLQLDAA